MKCESCDKEHDGSFGSGRFCNQKCASRFSSSHVIGTKKAICIVCGIETLVDKRTSLKQAKCDEHRTKRYNFSECQYCGKILKIKQKYCNHACKHQHQYETRIKEWKSGEWDGSKTHGIVVSSYIRRYLWEKYEGKCSRCGWDTPNPYIKKCILEIEHIDGDSTNNDEENLDLICPNCHSLTSTYKALNYGNGNRKRLKYFKLID